MGESNPTRRKDPILEGIPIVTGPSRQVLNERQVIDYRTHRRSMLTWLATTGKNPERAEGYSKASLKNTAYRLDQFYRWVWDRNGYSIDIGHDQANSYLEWVAEQDTSQSNKTKIQTALKRLFKWRVHELGEDSWKPTRSFSSGEDSSQPRDFLTRQERSKIREASLEYGSIPGYNDLNPTDRNRWKRHLSQRLGKPLSEISPADWDQANSWKIPSLVWTSLDAGLRPVEVERAVTYWVDVQNGVLRIPKEESSDSVIDLIRGEPTK